MPIQQFFSPRVFNNKVSWVFWDVRCESACRRFGRSWCLHVKGQEFPKVGEAVLLALYKMASSLFTEMRVVAEMCGTARLMLWWGWDRGWPLPVLYHAVIRQVFCHSVYSRTWGWFVKTCRELRINRAFRKALTWPSGNQWYPFHRRATMSLHMRQCTCQ